MLASKDASCAVHVQEAMDHAIRNGARSYPAAAGSALARLITSGWSRCAGLFLPGEDRTGSVVPEGSVSSRGL